MKEGVVGGGVAGVKSDEDVDAVRGMPLVNLADLEAEFSEAQFAGGGVGGGDQFGAGLDADDFRVPVALTQGECESEGEVAFASAHVCDLEGAFLFPSGLVEEVSEEFAKALNLAEFSCFSRPGQSLGVGDAELLEKGFPSEGGLFGMDAVVLERRGGEEGGALGADGDVSGALALEEEIPGGGEEVGAPPVVGEGFGEELGALFGRMVLGGFPCGETLHKAKAAPFFEFNGACLEVAGAVFEALGLAEGQFDESGGLPRGAEVLEKLGGWKHGEDVG